MKILHLVNFNYYETKMSRIRFHGMEAIDNLDDVDVDMWGSGWYGYDDNLTVQQNLDNREDKYDLIVCFKPLEYKNLSEVSIPVCLRFNEMFDKNLTIKEIVRSRCSLVVCHHYNDYVEYKNMFSKIEPQYFIKFVYVPHSVETTIFKPIPEIKKDYDVILIGATNVQTMLGEHYPLRARFRSLIKKMPSKYKCAVLPHVGGSHEDAYTNVYMVDFAKKINSSKIVVTDSGVPKSRFGKYLEIPACGSAIAADIPDDHPDDVKRLKEFIIEINMSMTDQEIIDKLVYHLENDELRSSLVKKGLDYVKDYTQPKYAERFMKEVELFFEEYNK